MPYFVPLLPFLHFFHINMFILLIMSILCKIFHHNVRYPFFKANFVKIWNLAPKEVKCPIFDTLTLTQCTFFSFYPFFCIIFGEQSKSVIFFGPIKILGKKGKKRVLYAFWSKILKIAKFHFFPKIVLFYTLFTLFVLFVHKCDLFTNSGYFMLKRIPECIIPFF